MGKKRIVTKTGTERLSISEKARLLAQKLAKKKGINQVKIYIRASYNNTVLTLTDLKGNVLAWVTAGSLGFKGPKKATPYAASKVAEVLMEAIKKMGVSSAEVYLEGIGAGRQSALYSLAAQGLNIVLIKDITPIPHNGPKPPNVRRV